LKKGKKCPKCNSPYSNFSLKIWKQKITHSLLCDECDKEEIEKAVNSEWEKQKKLIDGGPGLHGLGFQGGRSDVHSKFIRRKPGT